jgi:ActR/RegA family two-component response regulator
MNILVISESPEIFDFLKKVVETKGDTIYHSGKRDTIKSLIHHWGIRIIVLRLTPEETADFAPLRDIRNFDPLIDVILVGPSLPMEKTVEAIHLGALDYLEEPLEGGDVLEILSRIQEKIELRKQTFRLEKQLAEKYVFEGMVGRSAAMLEMFSLIERLAGVTVNLEDGSKTATGADGRYRFPNVAEGPHQIRIEESAIPAFYYLMSPIRVDVLIEPREIRQVSFPLIAGGNAAGRFIDDADRNGKADPEEKGIGEILVILTPVLNNAPAAAKPAEAQAAIQNTYTRTDRTFRFVNIFPGEYDLSLDSETLPKGATPAATFPLRIKIEPHGTVSGIDILVTPRARHQEKIGSFARRPEEIPVNR